MIKAARKYREQLLADRHRPAYHFTVTHGSGHPGDPNGAFYVDGVYHLMYLYRSAETDGFHWGHASSRDLLHWRHHPDALTVHEGDRGCYSGGAFVDDDNTAYLSFWKFAATDPAKDRSGIGLACAKPPYIHWERMEPIAVNASAWGVTDMEMTRDNIRIFSEAYKGCMSEEDLEMMKLARAEYEARTKVGCTACKYCMPCPAGVDIPGIFARWNGAFQYSENIAGNRAYKRMIEKECDATRCVECRACEAVCPQDISIPEMLKKAHDELI